MIDDIEPLVETAVSDVFRTMLNLNARLEVANGALARSGPHIASSVGFTGRMTGVIFLYTTNHFARRVTGGLLGLQDREIDGDEIVNDAMGELANMVVGNIKSRLCDRGLPCVLTIPSIVRGDHFTIESVTSSERRLLSFQCEDHQLLVEVLMKQAQPKPPNSVSLSTLSAVSA